MKAFINQFVSLCGLLAVIGSFSACQDKDEVVPAPVISRVRTVSRDSISTYQTPYNLDSTYTATRTTPVAFDSTTALGRPGTLYAIIGQNLQTVTAVYFNDVNAYFNPALVTNTSIVITIPQTTPFTGSSKLKVVTLGGTVEYDFAIQQPAPVITRIDQLAGAAGDVITITGTTFDNVSAVRFGTAVATITEKTATQLKVTVPASVSTAAISVTTPGGTVAYGIPFGFRTPIFTEALATGWSPGGWSGASEVPSKGVAKRGTQSLKYEYTGGYGGFQLSNGGPSLSLAGATGLKFSIYGGSGTEGKIVKLVLNGNYDAGLQIVLHAGTWTDYAVPITTLGATGSLADITIQEFSGNVPTVIYVDDLGLY